MYHGMPPAYPHSLPNYWSAPLFCPPAPPAHLPARPESAPLVVCGDIELAPARPQNVCIIV